MGKATSRKETGLLEAAAVDSLCSWEGTLQEGEGRVRRKSRQAGYYPQRYTYWSNGEWSGKPGLLTSTVRHDGNNPVCVYSKGGICFKLNANVFQRYTVSAQNSLFFTLLSLLSLFHNTHLRSVQSTPHCVLWLNYCCGISVFWRNCGGLLQADFSFEALIIS